jgi:hypothetical protein
MPLIFLKFRVGLLFTNLIFFKKNKKSEKYIKKLDKILRSLVKKIFESATFAWLNFKF